MKTHTALFELELSEEIAIDVEYFYSSTPANRSGHPDTWTPAESECGVFLPSDIDDQLKAFALSMIPKWKKEIVRQASNLEFDNTPAVWASDEEDAAQGAKDDYLDGVAEDRRLEQMERDQDLADNDHNETFGDTYENKGDF